MKLIIIVSFILLIFLMTIILADSQNIKNLKDNLLLVSLDKSDHLPLEQYSFNIQEYNLSPADWPVVHLLPNSLNFSKDSWKSEYKGHIDITISNPENAGISFATIKLKIPPGWEYYPEIENDIINFDPNEVEFWISSFSGNYSHTWIEIKPGPRVPAGEYEIFAESYIYFQNSTIGYTSKSSSDIIHVSVLDDSSFKDYIWFFSMICAICALSSLFFNHDFREFIKKRFTTWKKALKK